MLRIFSIVLDWLGTLITRLFAESESSQPSPLVNIDTKTDDYTSYFGSWGSVDLDPKTDCISYFGPRLEVKRPSGASGLYFGCSGPISQHNLCGEIPLDTTEPKSKFLNVDGERAINLD